MGAVMWPKWFTWPWGVRSRDARASPAWGRPVCITTGAGQWEDAYLSGHFPGVRVCTRCAHNSKLFILQYTHLSSPLNRPSHSVLPGFKTWQVRPHNSLSPIIDSLLSTIISSSNQQASLVIVPFWYGERRWGILLRIFKIIKLTVTEYSSLIVHFTLFIG